MRSRITIGAALAAWVALAVFAVTRMATPDAEAPMPIADLLEGAGLVDSSTSPDRSTTFWIDTSRFCSLMVSRDGVTATRHRSDVCPASDVAAVGPDLLYAPIESAVERGRQDLGLLDGQGRLLDTHQVPNDGHVTFVEPRSKRQY